MLITRLFVPRKLPNCNLKIHLEMRKKSEDFVKIVQTSDPCGANLWPKFVILIVWGLYSHISAPINVKFGTGADLPFPRAKFHSYRGNVSPLVRGEKPILDH